MSSMVFGPARTSEEGVGRIVHQRQDGYPAHLGHGQSTDDTTGNVVDGTDRIVRRGVHRRIFV